MVKAQKKIYLTKEAILDRITEYDILMAFWPSHRLLRLNTEILSPFRAENRPSFIVGTMYGCITYKDMGAYEYRGDIWRFVQQIERLQDYNSALIAIDTKFSLGLSTGEPIKGKSELIKWEQPKIDVIKPPTIKVVARNFNKDELDWWNMYYQDISDLKRENIYVPKNIYRNGTKQCIKSSDLIFCYFYPSVEKWKVYRPLKTGKKRAFPEDRKWDTNLHFTYIENISSLENSNVGIVTKSKKDRMVITKIIGIQSICNTQAEDPACFTEESLEFINQNVKRKIVNGDSDKKGKEFSWWLTKQHGFGHINVPDKYLEEGISDFADLCRYYGVDKVRQIFEDKNII